LCARLAFLSCGEGLRNGFHGFALEYPLKVLRLNTDAVVAHGKHPAPILSLSADMNFRGSQEALAEKADLHPTHISLIERFERNPSLNVANSLAKAVGATLSGLIAEAETVQRRGSDV
jgi:DNA-binding XRE family transcriptional regulator